MAHSAVIPAARGKILPLVLAGLLLALTGAFDPVCGADAMTLPPQTVAPGEVQLTVNLTLPPGHKLNDEAPSTLIISAQNQAVVAVDKKFSGNLKAADLPVTLKVPANEGKTTLQAEFKINFCDDQVGLCFMRDAVIQLPVAVNKTADNKKLAINYELKMP